MVVESCAQLFDQLRRRVFYKDRNKTPSSDDRRYIIAACHSWFDYRNKLLLLKNIDQDSVKQIDQYLKSMLQAAYTSKRRSYYQQLYKKVAKVFEGIFVHAQVAEWDQKDGIAVADPVVLEALNRFNPDLERRYIQATYDLADESRISYAGTANELREVIRLTLHLQSPDDEVMEKGWFKSARTGKNNLPIKPTQAERVRFILESRQAGDQALKNTQEEEHLVEEMLGKVVRSSYDRMSASVHGNKDRDEIIRALRYIHAFLLDILPS